MRVDAPEADRIRRQPVPADVEASCLAAPSGAPDVSDGIAHEELNGLAYMVWGRLAVLAVLAVWVLTLPFERSAGYLLAILVTVWRSRQLVRRQVAVESERASLSRYFSPSIVRELSTNGRALDTPVVQPAAILFADMVGFTRRSERMEPEAMVGLLRDLHGRVARVVFANSGTIDKYIGDAIMVHFGTPHPRDETPCALSPAPAP